MIETEEQKSEEEHRDLDQLIVEINKRHDECEEAEASALESAIEAGKALLEAQEQVEPGKWMEWMAENLTCGKVDAQRYMRFAYFEEQLAEAGARTVHEAIQLCKFDLVRPRATADWNSLQTPELTDKVRKLRSEGVSYSNIAKQLGFSYSTVRGWVDTDFRKRKAEYQKQRDARGREERTEARRIKKQMERDALAKEKGGKTAQAYSLIRRTLSELDRALGETQDPETRIALKEAIVSAHRSEDFIVAALRGRGTLRKERT